MRATWNLLLCQLILRCADSLVAPRVYTSLLPVPGAMAPQGEMSVGLKKGHKVTKLPRKIRPSRRRGVSGGGRGKAARRDEGSGRVRVLY